MTALPRSIIGGLAVAAVVGCSSSRTDKPTAAGDASSRAVVVRSRDARLLPDITSRPKPFRVADAVRELQVGDRTDGRTAPAGRIETVAATLPAEPGKLHATAASMKALTGGGTKALDEANPTVAEIRGMLRSYLRAFNRHDPAALAAHWSESGENGDLDSGEVTAAGRGAVRDVFAALFQEDEEATIDIDVTSIRPLREDVAVVDGVSLISFTEGGPASSRFSAVVVKQDGRWVLENVREAAQPVAAAAAPRPLESLHWLVGSWEDAGEGVTAGTDCTWSAGRAYLIRNHVIAADSGPESRPVAGDDRIPGLLPAADGKGRELTEIIGWDPDRRTIRSWIFSSDGRFAEGTWSRDGEAWTIHVEGRGRDEGCDATCTIVPHGDDALTVRCVTDRLANVLPPACDFTRTSR